MSRHNSAPTLTSLGFTRPPLWNVWTDGERLACLAEIAKAVDAAHERIDGKSWLETRIEAAKRTGRAV